MKLINNYVIDQGGVDEFVGETLKDLENAYSGWNDNSILHNSFILSEDEDSEMLMSDISDYSTNVNDERLQGSDEVINIKTSHKNTSKLPI
jgi:hypothetical protein